MAYVRSRSVGTSDLGTPNVLAKAVGDAYAVDGFEPELAFDFTGETYRTDGSATTFSGAMTHSATSLGTMVDGYGPELVKNGTFDSNTGNWNAQVGATIASVSGELQVTASSTNNSGANQSISGLTVGATYVATATGRRGTCTDVIRFGINGIGDVYSNSTSNVNLTYTFVATATNLQIQGVVGGTSSNGQTAYFDNISLREVPAIKWRPHNLATYSEDFSNAAWGKTSCTIAANTTNSPDGTLTADTLVSAAATASTYVSHSSGVTVPSTYGFSVYVKTNGAQYVQLFYTSSLTSKYVNFDLSAGIVAGGSYTTASIKDVGGGWYKIQSIESYANGGNSCFIAVVDSSSSIRGAGYTGNGTSGIHLWGAHIYRSDLGGMVDNPDRGDSYVPTTSAAVYLPRRGHYVYNGQAWTNRGLLLESEARTNLLTYSNDFSGQWALTDVVDTANSIASPDNTSNAFYAVANSTSSGFHRFTSSCSIAQSTTYTFTTYLKAGGYTLGGLSFYDGVAFQARTLFDLSNGTINSTVEGSATIEDVGNGWYRCSITGTTDAAASASGTVYISVNSLFGYIGDDVSGIYSYGAQFEAGSTPSSYMPTSAATFTRAAETLTVAAADLPYPTPNIVGSELVTNGHFNSDSDWTKGAGWTISDGVAVGSSATSNLQQTFPAVSGRTYEISFDIVSYTSGNINRVQIAAVSGPILSASAIGTYVSHITAPSTGNLQLYIVGASGFTGSIDNVSVKEMQPLALGIQMQGTMTYADDGSEVNMVRWYKAGSDRIEDYLATSSANVGQYRTLQIASGVSDSVLGAFNDYSPGINVPFNIASRHGSTFINGAVDGTALTADTTPTALPDLSATNLQLGYDFMGTIDEFRMWGSMDIGDTTIASATS